MFKARLLSLATATGALSPVSLKMVGDTLDRIDAEQTRRAAINAASRRLNPEGKLSNWQVAQKIEKDLPILNRIRPGRELSEYESALKVIAEGATSARRIHDVLIEREG